MQDYPIEAYQRQGETKSRRCLRDRRKAAKKKGMTPSEYLAYIAKSKPNTIKPDVEIAVASISDPDEIICLPDISTISEDYREVSVDTEKPSDECVEIYAYDSVETYESLDVANMIKDLKDQVGTIILNAITTSKLTAKEQAIKKHLIEDLGESSDIFDKVLKLKENTSKESYELTKSDVELIITLTAAESYLDASADLKDSLKKWIAPHETESDIEFSELLRRRDYGLLHKISSKTMGLNIYRNMLLTEQRIAREAM